MRVVVWSVSGTLLAEFDSEFGVKVCAIKHQVMKHAHVPVICQKLVFGESVLCDGDIIGPQHIDLQKQLRLTLVLWHADIYEKLSSGKPCDRVEAAEAIGELAPLGDERFVGALVECLRGQPSMVKLASINALARVAGKGTSTVVLSLCNCLGDTDRDVRNAAASAIGKIACFGDPDALAAIAKHFRAAGQAAADALLILAPKGHRVIITQLQNICSPLESADVRRAAVCALSQLACENDAEAIATLCCFSKDVAGEVREAAVNGLSLVAPQGHEEAMSLMVSCMRDWHVGVKKAAVCGLARVTPKGNDRVIGALCDTIMTECSEVRILAIRALIQVAPLGNWLAIAVLSEQDEFVDQTAAQWLADSTNRNPSN